MRVWVSGARGKLGAEVCRQLTAAGHEVTAADLTGDAPVDLMDPASVRESLTGADAIVHCAAIPTPEAIDPAQLVLRNTMTTFNAMEEAWKLGIRHAVLASSGSLYGPAWSPVDLPWPSAPVDEQTQLQYVDPYALSKDFLERTGEMYARRGMQVTALRFHWILTPAEVREFVAEAPPAANASNLWGYVDLGEAARACLLALAPRADIDRFLTLLITAEDTGSRRPTAELLAEHAPATTVTRPLPGTTSVFDCGRAASTIGWTHQSRWRTG
ncbi:NAD-dependent epimerase/dehydratase family protein [Kribbella deserti]|uniref:NAD-dependent epimerase/dehydratase family protein n=1 Tax=Kribbella deserti TaxID=1926257 RepID=A0ABV6QHN3_9ACTN